MQEELKMILEALTSLGANGKEAFIWWLLLKYALHYFVVLVLILAAAFIGARIILAIRTVQEECRIVFEVALRAGVRPGHYYDRTELNKMIDWVRRSTP